MAPGTWARRVTGLSSSSWVTAGRSGPGQTKPGQNFPGLDRGQPGTPPEHQGEPLTALRRSAGYPGSWPGPRFQARDRFLAGKRAANKKKPSAWRSRAYWWRSVTGKIRFELRAQGFVGIDLPNRDATTSSANLAHTTRCGLDAKLNATSGQNRWIVSLIRRGVYERMNFRGSDVITRRDYRILHKGASVTHDLPNI